MQQRLVSLPARSRYTLTALATVFACIFTLPPKFEQFTAGVSQSNESCTRELRAPRIICRCQPEHVKHACR